MIGSGIFFVYEVSGDGEGCRKLWCMQYILRDSKQSLIPGKKQQSTQTSTEMPYRI